MTKLLKEIEEAMIWAYENKKMELFSILQEFFDQAEEDYEEEESSSSEDDIQFKMDSEEVSVVKDKDGFLSLA